MWLHLHFRVIRTILTRSIMMSSSNDTRSALLGRKAMIPGPPDRRALRGSRQHWACWPRRRVSRELEVRHFLTH